MDGSARTATSPTSTAGRLCSDVSPRAAENIPVRASDDLLCNVPDCPLGARLIPLTRGKFAIVDEADYERVAAFKWTALHPSRTNWYGFRYEGPRDARKGIYLHRFILDAPAGVLVDHVNGDGLDCRRSNLRLCDATGNARNRRSNGSAKGYYVTRHGRFAVRLKVGNRQKYIGTFEREDDALAAYDTAARLYFGAFARLNFPDSEGAAPALSHVMNMPEERAPCPASRWVTG
jgi:hypothetical protein